MTACSSILALGMMPLCLLIYTTTWTSSGAIQIPYDSIGRWLSSELCSAPLRAVLLTGLCEPLVLRHHSGGSSHPHCLWDIRQAPVAPCSQEDPEGLRDHGRIRNAPPPILRPDVHTPPFSFVALQVGSIAGFALIVIIAVVGGVLYQSSWVIAPSLWIIGTIFPFIGYGLGFLLARFVGQPWHR